jgi:hypothetical protein
MRRDCGVSRKMGSAHLGVVDLASAEQGIQGVVAGDNESGNVDEELAGNVEEDEEEVQASETENGVDLGYRGLLLKVVEGGVLGQLDNKIVSTTVHRRRRYVCKSFTSNSYLNKYCTCDMYPEEELTSLSSCDSVCWARSCADMVRGAER